jgi:hypothetical protein
VTRLLLGAGLLLGVAYAVRKLIEVAGRPLTELDELYDTSRLPQRDPYLDDLLNRRMTSDLFPHHILGGRTYP